MGKRISLYTLKMVKEKSAVYELDNLFIKSPSDALNILEKVLDLNSECVENFGIIALNIKNKVVGLHVISRGTLNSSLVHPREVFKSAMANNAASIILFHNHPSGISEPSSEDIKITKRLIEAGQILGIDVLDHIIIGEDNFKSLKEMGLVD